MSIRRKALKILLLATRRNSEKFVRESDIIGNRKFLERAMGIPLLSYPSRKYDVIAGTLPALWVYPFKSRPGPVILYLHGGGYVIGSPSTHLSLVARILRHTGGRALLLDYRLAPENPFPAQREDACEAYKWLLESGIKSSEIVIAGDSAGGGLTVATVQSLRDTGVPLPACCVCLSPWTDMSISGASITNKAKRDVMLTKEIILFYAKAFAGSKSLSDPEISPLFNDMHCLPPFLIQVGSDEILLDDSVRLAEKIKSAGGQVDLNIYSKMFHCFQVAAGVLQPAREALREMASFINDNTGR